MSVDDGGRRFREKLAVKKNDCRELTAEDILLDVLERVRSTPEDRGVRMVILWHDYDVSNPDGPVRSYMRMANNTISRIIATLAASQHDLISQWNAPANKRE